MTSLSGSTIYIKQVGLNTQYSYDMNIWNTVNAWPIAIATEGAVVNFVTDIVFSINYQHFVCAADGIQFGSPQTKTNVTIADCINYPGLINNGSICNSGYSNIKIYNINVFGEGTTELFWIDLAGEDDDQGGGYVCQQWFGLNSAHNYVIGCNSTGCIAKGCGGISGANTQNTTFIHCSSSGVIGYNGVTSGVLGAGGIVGARCSYVSIINCWSTGTIVGNHCGGIAGAYFKHGGFISGCHTSGDIMGSGAGGIAGYGMDDTILKSCYTTGIVKGVRSGGISGAFTGSVEIRNCYTTGDVSNGCGAICGAHPAKNNIRLYNCYACGKVDNGGYFNSVKLELNMLKDCYSEVQNGNPAIWDEARAQNVLVEGIPKISCDTYDGFVGGCIQGLLEINDDSYVLFGDKEFTADSKTGRILISATTPINTYDLLLVGLAEKDSLCIHLKINVSEPAVKPAPEPAVKPAPEPAVNLAPEPAVKPVSLPVAQPRAAPLPQIQPRSVPQPRSNPFAMSYVQYNSPSIYIPVGVSVLPEGKPVNPMGAQNLQAKVGRT